MASNDKYFQFPISILRSTAWNDSRSLCAAIVEVAIVQLSKLDYVEFEKKQNMVERYIERNEIDEPATMPGFNIIAAAEYLEVFCGSDWLGVLTRAQRFSDGGTQCRLRTEILWDAIKYEWPLNQTRLLIAVYAGIGQNKYQWLTYSKLGALAAGYSGHTAAKRNSMRNCLTEKTVRHWIDKLWQRNFFQVVSQRRKRFYSNKFSSDEALANHIVANQSKTKKRIRI